MPTITPTNDVKTAGNVARNARRAGQHVSVVRIGTEYRVIAGEVYAVLQTVAELRAQGGVKVC